MSNESPVWPSEHISLEAASQWVASTCAHEVGPPQILQVKRWGVTARFDSLVLKASFTPLFPQVLNVHAVLERALPGAVPRLLASESVDGQLWTLFEHVSGPTAEQVETPEALVAMALELARVQAAVAKQNLTGLPTIDVRSVPRLLFDVDDLEDQPEELVEWLHAAQAALQSDADELATIPASLDHPDVNSTNAIMRDDGRAILLDWEEATVGCPLFSLDRLLADAREHDAIEPVTDAYLDSVSWADREALDRAMRLAPLKLALEARVFARALGWPDPHTRYTSRLLERARKRCQSAR